MLKEKSEHIDEDKT